MSIEKLIQENTAALLALTEAIKGMGVAKSAAPVAEVKAESKPEKKQEAEKPVATPPAETKVVETVGATESPSEAPKEETNNGFPVKTYDDCAELVKKLAASKGRDPIVKVLSGFGVKGLSDIDKAHYGAVWAQLKAELDA